MSTITTLLELRLEFLECAVHTILHTRHIYPEVLFEQRKFLGVSCWQARHPDIASYIHRVVQNSKEVFNMGVVDRLILTVTDGVGAVADQLSIKCDLHVDSSAHHGGTISNADVALVEEELRSTILRLSLLDSQLSKPSEDCTWSLMLSTKQQVSSDQTEALRGALRSGEWFVDSNQLPENVALSLQVQARSRSGICVNDSSSSSISANVPAPPAAAAALVPVKSFRNGLLNLSVCAHTFAKQ